MQMNLQSPGTGDKDNTEGSLGRQLQKLTRHVLHKYWFDNEALNKGGGLD